MSTVEHVYVSTACHHELHHRCREVCKFCPARCLCRCHPWRDEVMREVHRRFLAVIEQEVPDEPVIIDTDSVLAVLRRATRDD